MDPQERERGDADVQARLAAAAELDDPERVRVLEEIYATLEADLERESPGS